MLNQVIILYLLAVLVLFTSPMWVAFIWRVLVINGRKKRLLMSYCEKNELLYQETQKGLRVSKRVRLEGEISGHKVTIFDKKVGFGRRSYFKSFIEIDAPEIDFHFYISRENIFSKVKEKIGKGDIQVGNPLIDSKLYFHTENEKKLLNWLKSSEELLEKLTPEFRGIIEQKEGKLTYVIEKELKNEKNLANADKHLQLMLNLADASFK
ncbi:MAG: hypothetical protein AAF789_09380 [Bacteroidota bacterium]